MTYNGLAHKQCNKTLDLPQWFRKEKQLPKKGGLLQTILVQIIIDQTSQQSAHFFLILYFVFQI